MIKITDKSKCCGCTACFNKCPKNAITMIKDECGFKYPIVDEKKCINCGICDNVCPYNNEYMCRNKLNEPIVYGGWIKNEETRKLSTSGGIFSAISKIVLENNGVICGAIYNENLDVVHAIIDNLNDLKKINGSKYVQSDVKNNLKKIEEFLDKGKIVLFSGTPCQISGLNSFLNKEYDNLYTCDIVCHGVPSPKVFDKYKKELEQKNNSKLKSINFRDKITGWQDYSFSAEFENGFKYIEKSSENEYMKIFLDDIDLRESCSSCKFSKFPRCSDITLGDFWGVDNFYPELNDNNKGTSLVLVHTKKGQDLLENCNDIFVKECNLENSIKYNPSVLQHKISNKNRETFFKELDKMNLNELFVKYRKKKNLLKKFKSLFYKIFRNIRKNIKQIDNKQN